MFPSCVSFFTHTILFTVPQAPWSSAHASRTFRVYKYITFLLHSWIEWSWWCRQGGTLSQRWMKRLRELHENGASLSDDIGLQIYTERFIIASFRNSSLLDSLFRWHSAAPESSVSLRLSAIYTTNQIAAVDCHCHDTGVVSLPPGHRAHAPQDGSI